MPEKPDVVNPFYYSKEDLLRIYREGGGRGGLGLEVERWEGVVREVGSEPVSMKEWGDAERKVRPRCISHVLYVLTSIQHAFLALCRLSKFRGA